eukprot:gb/GECG01004297.1/.p1 GENE.gb/GECG01004297.1/~~gb/GECG01004297.1/.p1  ORF type:complete len:441 (+),score=49.60 gb/GECG01004297.1/:1-1323(+)
MSALQNTSVSGAMHEGDDTTNAGIISRTSSLSSEESQGATHSGVEGQDMDENGGTSTPLPSPSSVRSFDNNGRTGHSMASPMAPVAPRTMQTMMDLEDHNSTPRGSRIGGATASKTDPHSEPQRALSEKEKKQRLRTENERQEKWLKMLSNWDEFLKKNEKKVKSRCRKGIPEAIRAHAWPKIVRSNRHRDEQPGLYAQLLRSSPTAEQKEVIEYIERDIYRTFPHYPLFATRGGIGQTSLYRVLRAYAAYDSVVGYCQGMGFITAMFLSYMPEEEAFFMLLTVMQFPPHKLRELFVPGLPEVPIMHYQLKGMMRLKLPKLYNHFENENVDPSMYSTHWFLTVFTYNLPFHLVVRIWDAFLFEGWKIVFRVALALLQFAQDDLLDLSFEHIMKYFRHLHEKVDPERIMFLAFKLNIKRKQLEDLRQEYLTSVKGDAAEGN